MPMTTVSSTKELSNLKTVTGMLASCNMESFRARGPTFLLMVIGMKVRSITPPVLMAGYIRKAENPSEHFFVVLD